MSHIIGMPKRSGIKRPRDLNQRAKLVAQIATGEIEDRPPDDEKNPHAVALGRLGGMKGGIARARALTAKQRVAIATKAARARWRGDVDET
jgi:hypothetical protein